MRRPHQSVGSLLDGLDQFRTAPAELLARRGLLRRRDSKYVVPATALAPLLAGLGDDYQLLTAGEQQVASYRTLYFDTPELRCFHDHRRGRLARHKLRIRHYPDRHVSFFEVKTKRGSGVTDKRRAPRRYGDDELSAHDLAFVAAHCDVPAGALTPRVWTDFSRVTLIGVTTVERVTIDVDLTLRRDDDPRVEHLAGVAIVEVKQSPFCAHTPVMQALRRIGARTRSASKFCTAIALTHPAVRMNRLLPTLRAMERIRA